LARVASKVSILDLGCISVAWYFGVLAD